MKERPILFSVTTGKPSQRGKRLRSVDGLTWKQRNKEEINARRRAMYLEDVEKHRARASQYRKTNREKVNQVNAAWLVKYRARLRSEMIEAYGGKCSCCGETEPLFLQLDHINNDGHLDRKVNKTSAKLWAKLKKAGWPKDRHQLLCANCNFGKLMNDGICPHQEMEVQCA